jgi:hypothetical protein
MAKIWSKIVDPITANLPAGVDLSDASVRSSIVDSAVPNIQEALKSGTAGGNVGTSLDGDSSFLTGADPNLTAPFLNGFSDATVTVYWVGLAVVLVAFVLSFFLKAAPLRAKSALQENADNEAALLAQSAAAETGALVSPDVSFDDANEPAKK